MRCSLCLPTLAFRLLKGKTIQIDSRSGSTAKPVRLFAQIEFILLFGFLYLAKLNKQKNKPIKFCVSFLSLRFPNQHSTAVWGYECVNSRCIKRELTNDNNTKAVSLPICRIFCGDDPGTIWPKPSGPVTINNIISRINLAAVRLNVLKPSKANEAFWSANEARFLDQINRKIPKSIKLDSQGNGLAVNIEVVKPDDLSLTQQTNESYVLSAVESEGNVVVTIKAETVFGARHGLETLSQLVVFDDIRNELQVPKEFSIQDKPFYAHRGLLLDTSRNYYTVESIKRTIGKHFCRRSILI